MPQSLRILFAGSGEFGLPTLKALLQAGHQLTQIYSQPDRPAGRGRALTPTPIAQFALDQSLPLIRTANLNAEPLPPADVMVVIAFGQKIADPIANHCRFGSVNLHASLLPKYRGAAPIHWAILRGETVTGNSIIRLAARMDAGAVLGQSRIEIGQAETTGELHDRLALDGAPLMLKTLEELADSRAVETVQDEALATIAPKLSRETATIDWSQPADIVARLIRGLSPWPGCRVRLVDSSKKEIARLTLVRAIPGPLSNASPGHIDTNHHVAAGNHTSVEMLEIQPEGKRPMSLTDFKNGKPWGPGLSLEPIQ